MNPRPGFAWVIVVGLVLGGTLVLPAEASASPPSEPGSLGGTSALGDAFDSTESAASREDQAQPESQEVPASSEELDFSEFGKWLSVANEELSDVSLHVTYRETGSGLDVEILGNYPNPLKIALKQEWIERHARDPSLEGRTFSTENLASGDYYAVTLSNVTGYVALRWSTFEPRTTQPLFSLGSSLSIRLERPMFVRLAAVPGWSVTPSTASSGNGSGERFIWSASLTIEFRSEDNSGQKVRFSRGWLESYGITDPIFRHENGALIPREMQGSHVVAYVDHFSSIVVDNQEGTAWTPSITGGSSFKSAAKTLQTEDAFRSPRRSMEVTFRPGGSGTDYGSVLSYREFTFTNLEMLRVWFYADRYEHDKNPTWDSLDAGIRLRLYDSGGTNFATFQYWLAAWYHNTDTKTPDANSKLIYGKPPLNKWTEFVAFPKTDWSADWASATRIRAEFYAAAAGTVGDYFTMYFDDFSYGVKTSKVTYIWTGTLQGDQVKADCKPVSFTVPSTVVYLRASLSIPPANSDLDLSLWDDQGRRTGGWTRADRTSKTQIPNSAYSGIGGKPETVSVDPPVSSGTWKAGCFLYSGNGHYEIRVELYTSEVLSSNTDSTRYYFTAQSSSYFVDAELRFPSANNYDLRLIDSSGRRTGGWTRTDQIVRSEIPYGTYSGRSVNPEWVFVDPPTAFGLWSAIAYAATGGGYYEIDLRVRDSARSWSVNLHDGDVGVNIATARQILDSYVVPLGVAHLRTDFWWSSIEPDANDVYNWGAVDFYRTYAAAAGVRGMDVVVVLKGFPQWAKNIYDSGDKTTFFNRWEEYCNFVAAEVGTYVDIYQILNEENWENVVDDGDEPTMSTRCMKGLAAGEGISEAFHKLRFKTAINANADFQVIPPFWDEWLRNWVNAAPASVDIIGMNHYPGAKECGTYMNWAKLSNLMTLVRDLGKEGAVTETGFPDQGAVVCVGLPSGEQEQVKYAQEAISVVSDLVLPHNRDYPRNRIILISWYELIDANTGGASGEDNYGILKTSLAKKAAYDVVRVKVADFGRMLVWRSIGTGLDDTFGAGVGLADFDASGKLDSIFMVLDEPSGANNFYYKVGWGLNLDGSFDSWSPTSGLFGPFTAGGDTSFGGALALGDIDRNGVMDAIFLNVDAPFGEDNYRYRVAFNIKTTGTQKGQFTSWSGVLGYVGVGGWISAGGGAALGDVDRNGILDVVFMVIDDADQYRYRIGWNIGTDGSVCGSCWSAVKAVAAPSAASQGGGLALFDWDADGWLDLFLLSLDDPPDPANVNFRYSIGHHLSTSGDVTGAWTETRGFHLLPGSEGLGADLAVGDVGGDGWIEILLVGINNPSGANDLRYRLRLGI